MPGLLAGFSTALPPMSDRVLTKAIVELLPGRNSSSRIPTLLAQTHSPLIYHHGGNSGNETPPPPFTNAGASTLRFDGAAGTAVHPGLLAVKTADCIPLLAVDPEVEGFAALHVGWRGAAERIVPNLLGSWRERGSSLRQVSLAIGPHIQGCCYEVKADCLTRFHEEDLHEAVVEQRGSTHLILAAVIKNQARRFGLEKERVEVAPECTYCYRDSQGHPSFASYRRAQRNGGGKAGTNIAIIGMA